MYSSLNCWIYGYCALYIFKNHYEVSIIHLKFLYTLTKYIPVHWLKNGQIAGVRIQFERFAEKKKKTRKQKPNDVYNNKKTAKKEGTIKQ